MKMLAALDKYLGHHDLPTMLGLVARLLRLLALDVDSRHTARISFKTYVILFFALATFFYTYQVSAYWYIFWHDGNLTFKIVLFSLAVSSLLGPNKLLCMYLNRNTLRKIVSEYLDCDSSVVAGSRMEVTVRVALRRVRRRAVLFWLLIICNGLVYVLRPLFTPGRHLTDDQQVLLGLEPMFESPNYEIALLAECSSVLFIAYAAATIPAFIIIIVGYSEAQLLALAQELLHLLDDAQRHFHLKTINHYGEMYKDNCLKRCNQPNRNWRTTPVIFRENRFFKTTVTVNPRREQLKLKYNKCHLKRLTTVTRTQSSQLTRSLREHSRVHQRNQLQQSLTLHLENQVTISENHFINDYVRNGLVSVIRTHALNITIINQVEDVFQNAMAMEFTLLSVSLIAELLGGLENTYLQLPFALVQVAMDCITGQKLIDASKEFEEAAYGCGWERLGAGGRRLALALLQGAQRAPRLSAGGVAGLGYPALLSVVRSIYSAYTALRSTVS